jgi:hypothetical protein
VQNVRSLRPYLPELQSTRLAARAVVEEDENTLAVELAVLVCLSAPLLPGVQEVAPALSCGRSPGLAAGCGPVGKDELDLRVRPFDRAVVAALPGGVDRPHEVEV